MSINIILIFNYFFATLIIFCRNSLYSIINLVFLIIFSCVIIFNLKVEFLTFILLLIYVGAISILFLFIVMMLDLDKTEKLNINFNYSNYYFIYFLLVLKFFFFFFFLNKKICVSLGIFSFEYIKYNNDINCFSQFLFNERNDNLIFINLFSQKFFLFIIIGIILLFSMVGSIALCLISNK
jgi:NADH:ubiquinone oxidoreductase subunit 6 (subunit J)